MNNDLLIIKDTRSSAFMRYVVNMLKKYVQCVINKYEKSEKELKSLDSFIIYYYNEVSLKKLSIKHEPRKLYTSHYPYISV